MLPEGVNGRHHHQDSCCNGHSVTGENSSCKGANRRGSLASPPRRRLGRLARGAMATMAAAALLLVLLLVGDCGLQRCASPRSRPLAVAAGAAAATSAASREALSQSTSNTTSLSNSTPTHASLVDKYAAATAAFRQQWAEVWAQRQRVLVRSSSNKSSSSKGGATDGDGDDVASRSEQQPQLVPLPLALGAPMANYVYDLPPAQVRKALVWRGGPNPRLRAKLAQATKGGSLMKVGVIGGSISFGSKASVIGKTDWFSLVGAFLRKAFPKTRWHFRNGCLPATPSAFMNICLETAVDEDVDLMFIEYVANDGSGKCNEARARTYERLVRKVLRKPHAPAVVLVQLMPKGMSEDKPDHLPYHQTLEDNYGALAQYYDLPWLSFRNALWKLAEFKQHGRKWRSYIADDGMHPVDTGMKVIADLVVNLLQETAIDLLFMPFGAQDTSLLSESMPPPVYVDNYDAPNRLCMHGKWLKETVVSHKGWNFVDEGSNGKQKLGYVSWVPGSLLEIQVNTTRSTLSQSTTDESKGDRMNVLIAYLKSYTNMGKAVVRCTKNCECLEEVIDAHHDHPTSTIFLMQVLPTQHPQCRIGITVVNETTSGKHKFKLTGVMMNEYTGPDVIERLHEEKFLGRMMAKSASNRQQKRRHVM